MKNTIIERIEIGAFGCLEDRVIVPDEGFNIIEDENEAGKSTLAAFIKFIFYGFSSTRKKDIAENEKELYMPWGKTRAFGSITLSNPDGEFKVSRIFDLPSKDKVEILDLTTRKKIYDETPPGDLLLGIPEDVFVKSALFMNPALSQNGDGDLAKSIQNIIFSADERISAANTQKHLQNAKAELLNRQNRGIIADLKDKAELCAQKCAIASELHEKIAAKDEFIFNYSNNLKATNKKYDALKAERLNAEKFAAATRLASLEKIQSAAEKAKSDYEAAAKAFSGQDIPPSEKIGELMKQNSEYMALLDTRNKTASDLRNLTKEFDESCEKIASFGGKEAKTQKKLKSKKTLLPIFILIAVFCAVIGGLTLYFNYLPPMPYIFFGVAGIFVLMSVWVIVSVGGLHKKFGFETNAQLKEALEALPGIKDRAEEQEKLAAQLKERYENIAAQCEQAEKDVKSAIEKYKFVSVDDESTERILSGLLEISGKIGTLSAVSANAQEARDAAFDNVDLEALREKAQGATVPEREIADIDREIEFTEKKKASLSEALNNAEKERASYEAQSPDPATVFAQKDALARNLKAANERYEALDLALQVLEESSAYMKAAVAPKLTAFASEYFCDATREKYQNLNLDPEMGMSVETPAEKSLDYFSSGTKDVAYICMRMALLKLIYKQKPLPPIILDDVFARLDANRTASALSVLAGVTQSQKQQLFLFTCTPRASVILDRLGYEYRKLTVKG